MSTALNEKLQQLKIDYLLGLSNKHERFRELLLKNEIDTILADLHKIKGSGSTYGLPELTEVSRLVETGLKQQPHRLHELLPGFLDMLHKIQLFQQKFGKPLNLDVDADFLKLKQLIDQSSGGGLNLPKKQKVS